MYVQKGKRNIRTKKNQKSSCDDQDNSADLNKHNSSSSSEEEGSKETSTTTVILNGKTRASRGAATDPQSLYARVTILILQYRSSNGLWIYIDFDSSFISNCFSFQFSAEKERADK